MKKLIESIMLNENMDQQEKIYLIERVAMASHGISRFISKGLYLHTDTVQQNSEREDVDMQLWFRNVDASGMTFHGPTEFSAEQIVDLLHDLYVKQFASEELNNSNAISK